MLSIGEKLTDLLPKQDFISGVADLEKLKQHNFLDGLSHFRQSELKKYPKACWRSRRPLVETIENSPQQVQMHLERLAFLNIAVQVHEGALWPRSGGRHTLNECMS